MGGLSIRSRTPPGGACEVRHGLVCAGVTCPQRSLRCLTSLWGSDTSQAPQKAWVGCEPELLSCPGLPHAHSEHTLPKTCTRQAGRVRRVRNLGEDRVHTRRTHCMISFVSSSCTRWSHGGSLGPSSLRESTLLVAMGLALGHARRPSRRGSTSGALPEQSLVRPAHREPCRS